MDEVEAEEPHRGIGGGTKKEIREREFYKIGKFPGKYMIFCDLNKLNTVPFAFWLL